MKNLLLQRLQIALFVLALVGWLLLITVPLELLGKDLTQLEEVFETNTFKWTLRVIVLAVLIFLIKGKSFIDSVLDKNIWLKKSVKIIVVVGVLGWIIGLASLVV